VFCHYFLPAMNASDLFYFIGKCLVMDDDPVARSSVATAVEEGIVPWERFVLTGSQHLVLPALYTAFKRNGVLPLLPVDLTEHLKNIYNLNLQRNRKMMRQSEDITRLLNSRGIEPLFLKGVGHLSQGLYHDQGDRVMTDIDIMIPEPDTAIAASLLSENGYRQDPEDREEDFEGHHHLPGFYHPDRIAFVELHRTPLSSKYNRLMTIEDIIAGKQKAGIDGAWVMSPKHQMILNFIHDQVHDREYRFRSVMMKGMYDFYLMSIQCPVSEIQPALKRYRKKFNAYCYYISVTFNNSKWPGHTNCRSARRFKWQTGYLKDHPKMFSFYLALVYNCDRVIKILRLFVTAPFRKYSRYYIRKKIGTGEARRKYYRKLTGR
jgi:hypothetical protein